VFPAASSVSLNLDIWSGNAKEDYISVVAHYVSDIGSYRKGLLVLG
jgi:hypothetical protein